MGREMVDRGEQNVWWANLKWWDDMTDDERDAALASAVMGSSTDFSYLDMEDDIDG